MDNATTIIRISKYLIQNVLSIKKHNLNMLMLIEISKDGILLEDEEKSYFISNLMEYRNIIDRLSSEYKCVLKYFPKINEDDYFNSLYEIKESRKVKIIV